MTSSEEISEAEITLQTKRITINIDEVTDRIIENLIGVKGKSKSAVVFQLVKDWIDDYGEKTLKNWNIDFGAIRRQVLSRYKEEEESKLSKLSTEELKILRELPILFETIEMISAEELAELVEVELKKLKSLILMNRVTLEKSGLKLVYREGTFYKSK